MPPRTANSPCSSAGSSRVNPASTSSSPRSVGEMSWPGLRSIEASSSRSGALTRGSSAAADATITRAVPVASACSARARAEATPKCGAMPRYGSTSCEGNGSTARSAAASESPSSARQKEADVGDGLLEVAVGRHDVQHSAVAASREPRPRRTAPWPAGSGRTPRAAGRVHRRCGRRRSSAAPGD